MSAAGTEASILEAWSKAQAAFRSMIDAKAYGNPVAPETMAYVNAERGLDNELAAARAVNTSYQRDGHYFSHDPECDCHHINREAAELALGDHHVGVGS